METGTGQHPCKASASSNPENPSEPGHGGMCRKPSTPTVRQEMAAKQAL